MQLNTLFNTNVRKCFASIAILTVATGLLAGCSSSSQTQSATKPYWAGGPKTLTSYQAAEAYTYSNYHPSVQPGSYATPQAPPDGQSEYEAFVNGGQK